MPRKTKLDVLKNNVEAQELRLQEAFSTFEASKSHPSDQQTPENPVDSPDSQQTPSSWDMLERIIGLEGDLLSSYREYSRELEKRVKKEEKNKLQKIANIIDQTIEKMEPICKQITEVSSISHYLLKLLLI